MAKPKGKQVDQLTGQVAVVGSVALPAGTSVVVTTLFSGKTPGGTDTVLGVFTASPQNKCQIRLTASGKALFDSSDRMVFARLTESSSVWTLSFFVLIAGAETAYNFTGHANQGNDIQIIYGEAVQFGEQKPTEAMSGIEGVDEISASNPLAHQHISETVPVTVNGQTAFTLSQTPVDGNDVRMEVNGVGYENGAGKDYTVSGTTVTWLDADFTLETIDEVIFYYAH